MGVSPQTKEFDHRIWTSAATGEAPGDGEERIDNS
jgi:hypothetical protein